MSEDSNRNKLQIHISHARSENFYSPEQVAFVMSDGNLCYFYLKSGLKEVVRVKIGDVMAKFNELGSYDVHHLVFAGRSYIINMDYVTGIDEIGRTITVHTNEANIVLPQKDHSKLSKKAVALIHDKYLEREASKKFSFYSSSILILNKPVASLNKHHDKAYGYEYVDLGLPSRTLWAIHNVNAREPESIGVPMGPDDDHNLSRGAYLRRLLDKYDVFYYGRLKDVKKYIYNDIKALQHWDKHWVKPTTKQWKELIDHCKWSLCRDIEGRRGALVEGPNKNVLYIPLPEDSGEEERIDGYQARGDDFPYLGFDINEKGVTPNISYYEDKEPYCAVRLVLDNK